MTARADLMMGRYYRTEDRAARVHDHRNPWGIQFSAGREFDPAGRIDPARPIVFVKLLDNPDGDVIARQPVVAGALLEIGAVWSELRASAEMFDAMEAEERAAALALLNREMLGRIYDPRLTLYSAPAHMLAKFAVLTDPIDAYRLGARLAHLVLNLDAPDFARLAPPDEFAMWSDMFDAFRANRDRGFAFASICACGGALAEGQSDRDWLDAALAAAGLDPSVTILERAHERMRADLVDDAGTAVGVAERYLLDLGERYFAARSPGDPGLSWSRITEAGLPAPPMFDAAEGQIELTPSLFDRSRFSPTALYNAASALHSWTVNLIDGCR